MTNTRDLVNPKVWGDLEVTNEVKAKKFTVVGNESEAQTSNVFQFFNDVEEDFYNKIESQTCEDGIHFFDVLGLENKTIGEAEAFEVYDNHLFYITASEKLTVKDLDTDESTTHQISGSTVSVVLALNVVSEPHEHPDDIFVVIVGTNNGTFPIMEIYKFDYKGTKTFSLFKTHNFSGIVGIQVGQLGNTIAKYGTNDTYIIMVSSTYNNQVTNTVYSIRNNAVILELNGDAALTQLVLSDINAESNYIGGNWRGEYNYKHVSFFKTTGADDNNYDVINIANKMIVINNQGVSTIHDGKMYLGFKNVCVDGIVNKNTIGSPAPAPTYNYKTYIFDPSSNTFTDTGNLINKTALVTFLPESNKATLIAAATYIDGRHIMNTYYINEDGSFELAGFPDINHGQIISSNIIYDRVINKMYVKTPTEVITTSIFIGNFVAVAKTKENKFNLLAYSITTSGSDTYRGYTVDNDGNVNKYVDIAPIIKNAIYDTAVFPYMNIKNPYDYLLDDRLVTDTPSAIGNLLYIGGSVCTDNYEDISNGGFFNRANTPYKPIFSNQKYLQLEDSLLYITEGKILKQMVYGEGVVTVGKKHVVVQDNFLSSSLL